MRRKKSSRGHFEGALIADAERPEAWEQAVHVEPPASPRPEWYRALKTTQMNTLSDRGQVSEANLKDAIDMVERFHGAVILLEKFDRENVRGRVETKESHPPREFAIVAAYLRILAHVRTLIELKSAAYFQAISMIARAVFELAVDIRLIDRIPDAPERYDAFSKVERLRVARRITEFHTTNPHEDHESPDLLAEPLQPFWVHEQFIRDNAESIDELAKKLWPKQFDKKSTIAHWSGKDLRQRAILVGPPFDEIYDVHYAELSWYTHPGIGVIATLAKEIYPLICGQAYGIAIRCYYETLRFMVQELRLHEFDQLIGKKLEFARLAAFSDDQQQAEQLRYELLGF